MPQDHLRSAIEGVRAKLHAEVEAQLGLLGARHEEALERAALSNQRDPAAEGARPDHSEASSHLLDAFSDIDRSTSLSDILTALVRNATVVAPRVALFVVNGTKLDEWIVPGIPPLSAGLVSVDSADFGMLVDALRQNRSIVAGGPHEVPAPPMVSLPAGRSAVAVPLAPGNQPVAVLYADEDFAGVAADGWRNTIEILARHASAHLAYITTIRTAEAIRLLDGTVGREPAVEPTASGDAQGARRHARLIVSELKLYNEAAVRAGREQRNLLQRLGPEIERARLSYEQHVPASVPGRDTYFRQELVQTLAGGDPALLG